MTTQTLASAFQDAMNRNTATRPAATSGTCDTILLAALERSATVRDQIIQRRIGISTQAPAKAP
jgi:hypothetical protein